MTFGRIFGLVAGAALLAMTGTAQAGSLCRSALTPEFGLEIGAEGLRVFIGDLDVYSVSGEKWRSMWNPPSHLPLAPSFRGCDVDMATDSELLMVRFGFAFSEAFAFGLNRGSDGKPSGLSVLEFHAHDTIYEFRYVGPGHTLWVFGRDKDLWWNVCWNKDANGKFLVGQGWRWGDAGSHCAAEQAKEWPGDRYGSFQHVPISTRD